VVLRKGIADLVYLGADLLLWQLGLRISFGPGSVCMLRGHELRHSTTDWFGHSRSSIVEAMPTAVKRAAARKKDQPVDIGTESENSCPGRAAVISSQEEEELDVDRFQAFGTARESAEGAILMQMHLDAMKERDNVDKKRKRKHQEDPRVKQESQKQS
jgi:hypothetical protein